MAFSGVVHAQGFAGLGEKAEEFAEVKPGYQLVFPDDYSPHPDYRIEWWYVTANLMAENGEQFGVQWTLFRQALKPGVVKSGWSNTEFWMGHAAVTNASTHKFAEKLARGGIGQAGAHAVPFDAWIDDWQFQATSEANPEKPKAYTLVAGGLDFSYSLNLKQQGQEILQGDNGYSQKSDQGQASYYFSHPFLAASGSVTLGGVTYQVEGTAWLDREWSSQPLAENQEGWDWFSLKLENGERVMVFRLRDNDGRAFYSGTWIMPDGSTQSIGADDLNLEPKTLSDVAGRKVPTGWLLKIPNHGLDVSISALNPQSWMATNVEYWEGPVLVTGTQDGVGYLEMTGY
jgi:predicted secreted hydrolase